MQKDTRRPREAGGAAEEAGGSSAMDSDQKDSTAKATLISRHFWHWTIEYFSMDFPLWDGIFGRLFCWYFWQTFSVDFSILPLLGNSLLDSWGVLKRYGTHDNQHCLGRRTLDEIKNLDAYRR